MHNFSVWLRTGSNPADNNRFSKPYWNIYSAISKDYNHTSLSLTLVSLLLHEQETQIERERQIDIWRQTIVFRSPVEKPRYFKKPAQCILFQCQDVKNANFCAFFLRFQNNVSFTVYFLEQFFSILFCSVLIFNVNQRLRPQQ